VSALARRRRVYVAPRRGLQRRLRTVAVRVPVGEGPAIAIGVGLVIALSAFVAKGGLQLDRMTYTEIGLMLAGTALCAAGLLWPRVSGRQGLGTVVAFAALTVVTVVALTWSLTPGDTWLDGDRMLAYLAVLAGGVALGRIAPRRASAVVQGVALGSTAIAGYALLAKVFPGVLDADDTFARLQPPFAYWNSVGLAAGLGIPPVMWLSARRSGHAAGNALAWPALGVLIVCLLLSYSRGALLSVGLGLALWFAVVPLRLRALLTLLGVLVVTLPVVAWAFAQDGLTTDNAPLALREDAGFALGAMLLLMLVALTVAGLASGFLAAVRPPTDRTRRRASQVLAFALLCVPAAAILALSNAPGGISGQVSKAWKQATDPNIAAPTNSPNRLTATSSVRARYYREAIKLYETSPVIGVGPGAYAKLRLRFRTDPSSIQHAHGYVPQMLADLGWLGMGLSLVVLVAWLLAASRAVGVRRSARGSPWDAERVSLATLAVVVVVFGLHSSIDWTWFVPGNAVVALLCAGYVASCAAPGVLRPAPAPRPDRARLAVAAVMGLFALAFAWAALQPVRSQNAEAAAFDRLDQGQLPQAASIAGIAHARDPLAINPLFDVAAIDTARGDRAGAQAALERAIELEPATAETWRRLGAFRLNVLHQPKAALKAYQTAWYLDPSLRSTTDVVIASRAVTGG
jgi:tetratricopeptide (TPR) repeat protein